MSLCLTSWPGSAGSGEGCTRRGRRQRGCRTPWDGAMTVPGSVMLLGPTLVLDPPRDLRSAKQESSPGRDADANPLCPGGGVTSPKPSLLSAGLGSGAERLCHGKSPREQLWHFTAAPAPGVITLLAFRLLGGLDEHPSELSSRDMSQRGPVTLSRALPGMGTVCASTLKPFPPGSCRSLAPHGAASHHIHGDVSPKT